MDCYEIRVAGHLGPRRARALGCAELRLLPGSGSLLVFVAADQAALCGLLIRLRDAGIALIAVQRVVASTGRVNGGARTETPPKEVPDVVP